MSNVKITALLGNSQKLDGGAMFGNAPKAVWSQWVLADEHNRIPLACRSILVEAKGKRILCETGIGAFFEPKLATRYGVQEREHILIKSLNEKGFRDEQIDFVILSHLHFDHAGGLLAPWSESSKGSLKLLFPNAMYVVGEEAFARSQSPHPRDRASFIPGLAEELLKSGRLIQIKDHKDSRVLPEHISFEFSHGHTPGQMHTVIQGQSGRLVFAGDLIPGQAWVHLPITMGYDRFAEQVIDEKAQFYKKYANAKDWFFFTHDHAVAMGQISADDKGKFSTTKTIDHPTQWIL